MSHLLRGHEVALQDALSVVWEPNHSAGYPGDSLSFGIRLYGRSVVLQVRRHSHACFCDNVL